MSRILIGLLTLIALTRCAGLPPGEGFQSCDAVAAGDFDSRFAPSGLKREAVNRGVRAALDATTFVTDPRLNDMTENCRKLQGYRIYTKPTENYVLKSLGVDTMVSGQCECVFKYIVIGTPSGDKGWNQSSLVHELIHAMQNCVGTPPNDAQSEAPGHENWVRDGIYKAIDYEKTQP